MRAWVLSAVRREGAAVSTCQTWDFKCRGGHILLRATFLVSTVSSKTPQVLRRKDRPWHENGRRAYAWLEAECTREPPPGHSSPATFTGDPWSPVVGVTGSGATTGHRASPLPLLRAWLSARGPLPVTSRGRTGTASDSLGADEDWRRHGHSSVTFATSRQEDLSSHGDSRAGVRIANSTSHHPKGLRKLPGVARLVRRN